MNNTPATIEVLTPEQEHQLALQGAMEVLTMAKAVVVKTDQDYRAADDACAAIKTAMKKAEAKRDELVRPLNTVVKKINAGFKDVENAFNQALTLYRTPMTAFQAELARQRKVAEDAARVEQARLQAIADEDARKERERAEEAGRVAREAAATAAAVEDPFEAALAQGQAEEAAALAQEASETYKQTIRDARAVEVIPDATPRVTGAGSKTYTIWEFEITDESLVPMKYRPIDQTLIARDVKELKDQANIPGVKVTSRIEVK